MAIKKIPQTYLDNEAVYTPIKTIGEKVNELIDSVGGEGDGTFENITVNNTATVDILISETAIDADAIDTESLQVNVGMTTATNSTTSIGGLFFLSGIPQTLTGAGAVNLTTKVTLLVTTGANALTLAAGSADGQIKIITMKTDGGDGTLTPTGLRGGTTIVFNDVGDTVTLLYKDSAWIVLANFGCTIS